MSEKAAGGAGLLLLAIVLGVAIFADVSLVVGLVALGCAVVLAGALLAASRRGSTR